MFWPFQHALTPSKTGIVWTPEPRTKKAASKSFSDANWGGCAHTWAELMENILDGWWDHIIEASRALNVVAGENSVEGAAGGKDIDGHNPTTVVFDWCVLPNFWSYYLVVELIEPPLLADKIIIRPYFVILMIFAISNHVYYLLYLIYNFQKSNFTILNMMCMSPKTLRDVLEHLEMPDRTFLGASYRY